MLLDNVNCHTRDFPNLLDGEPSLPWGIAQAWGPRATLATQAPLWPEHSILGLRLGEEDVVMSPPQRLGDQEECSGIPELAYQSILPPPTMNSRTPLSVSPQMSAPLTVARRKVQPKAGERRSPAWNAHKQCPMGGSLALVSAVLPRGVCKTGTIHREQPANMSHCSLK